MAGAPVLAAAPQPLPIDRWALEVGGAYASPREKEQPMEKKFLNHLGPQETGRGNSPWEHRLSLLINRSAAAPGAGF